MNGESFEKQLRDQALRPLPPGWRAEILAAAGATAPLPRGSERAESWWRLLLWPGPAAWGGVAAAWLLIAGFNQLTPGPTSSVAVRGGALTVYDFGGTLAMQRLLEADLQPSLEPPDPPRPKPGPRQRPRSGRVVPHRVFCV